MDNTAAAITVAFLLICSTVITQCLEPAPAQFEEWTQSLKASTKKPKVTRLHFYFHDITSGKNPTAVLVAQAKSANTSSTLFGMLAMMDDPLTVRPELASKVVGHARGIYGAADQQEAGLIMALSFVFTDGKYNGSSLSMLGMNRIFNSHREMPIIGGTGVFRFAQGYAIAKTYTFNLTSGDAVVEYNVTVEH